MPIARFKSFEEAADALLLQTRTTSVAARMRALFELSARLATPRRASGVRKFRSHEDAEADRSKPG